MQALHGAMVVWSVYGGGYTGPDSEDYAYLQKLHAHDIQVASNYPSTQGAEWVVGDQETFDSLFSEDLEENAACRDKQGNPTKALWIQPDPPYLPCHNDLDWQDFLVRRIENHVDGDADVVHIDEPAGTAEHLYLYGFCDSCMKPRCEEPVRIPSSRPTPRTRWE